MTPDDWRLRGQERYLQGATLQWRRYRPPSATWDHDHCEFCWQKFMAEPWPKTQQEAYVTTNGQERWICAACYADFREQFAWRLAPPVEPITVREAACADAPGIARVAVDTWRGAYRDLLPPAALAALSYAEREQRWTERLCGPPDGRVAYVAADDAGQVVGFTLGGPERSGDPVYRAEIYALYIRDAYQRRGLGRRLLAAAAPRVALAYGPALIIWVLAANAPARAFHEALGGRYLREQQIEIGGAALFEVAYGWPDAAALAQPSPP
jgi:ribosomal protein S18 acetylase RimI-like enzyme